MDSSTGIISGTPTVVGTFLPNIKVTDAVAASVTSGPLTLIIESDVGDLTVTNTSFVDGIINLVYVYGALNATGGVPPYTWDLASGTLPTGLSIVGSAIVGTPTVLGTFTFTPRVTDSTSATATSSIPLSITINNSVGVAVAPGAALAPKVVVK